MPGERQPIAVVSDGSALVSGADVEAVLRDCVEVISGLAGIPARAIVLGKVDSAQLLRIARDHPAILLTHTEPARARTAQQGLGAEHCVLTDQDATAIALAAAVRSVLAGRGRTPEDTRILVAGARMLPAVTTLLIAGRTRDLALWNLSDAAVFPLHQAVFGADVVVDLLGALPEDTGDPRLTVLTRNHVHTASAAAAGILRAAAKAPRPSFDIEVRLAATAALADVEPAGRPPMATAARVLADKVAAAVLAVCEPATLVAP
ncbi:hypothetical protein [Amycolatopsis panacis]|uniref:Malate dehydrogenase n=1 Tax=Amycolatopsis panacis TaxID=2340917 RepID=A0A419I996_9PSEU|nr:hypothetical protein [Amycolatopsis panacis]RJQ89123.1 hypothetical protein D5S19_05510 [Amycolatopsis panacis]